MARKPEIDILRFLGLSMIILAHTTPPVWLYQLRNFDVPMMVIASGLAFSHTGQANRSGQYLWRRVKRLIFPSWLFLSGYFCIVWFLKSEFEQLTLMRVLGSYALLEGIGYVWVVRVFMCVAVAAPFIKALNDKINDDVKYLMILVVLYVIYEVFLAFSLHSTDSYKKQVLSQVVHYGIAYSLVFALGLRMIVLSRNQSLVLLVLSFLIFVGYGLYYFAIHDSIVPTQKFKNPPSAYYLSYALFITTSVWLCADNIVRRINQHRYVKQGIYFISQNSFWIYLWHIPFAKILTMRGDISFLLKYICIYAVAVMAVVLQVGLVKKIILPAVRKERMRINLKMIFTG